MKATSATTIALLATLFCLGCKTEITMPKATRLTSSQTAIVEIDYQNLPGTWTILLKGILDLSQSDQFGVIKLQNPRKITVAPGIYQLNGIAETGDGPYNPRTFAYVQTTINAKQGKKYLLRLEIKNDLARMTATEAEVN